MELALYCPEYGYYEKEGDTIGRSGDYYTSVSVGKLFGELLGLQFAQWLKAGAEPKNGAEMSRSSAEQQVRIVEAGAHDGQLAEDILSWFRREEPRLYERAEYWIAEPSAARCQRQRARLGGFEGKVRWVTDLRKMAEMQGAGLCGIIFANELLDAFPVHRLGWDAEKRDWYEWGVDFKGGAFVWRRLAENATRQVLAQSVNLPEALLGVLPHGFIVEVCPAARVWWQQAARLLRCGKLLTLDYGSEEPLSPERAGGSLRAYYRHQPSCDLLARPGEQDLTANVEFQALIVVGETEGLRTEAFITQEQFLTPLALKASHTHGTTPGDWLRRYRRQLQTLTHPTLLGRAFRVLVQAR